MARLLADEQFPVKIVYRLRRLGHEVLTVREKGTSKFGDALTDEAVLEIARQEKRALLTRNIKHFRHLHFSAPSHAGIIACSFSDAREPKVIARQIDAAIKHQRGRLKSKWVRVRIHATD